MFLTNAPLFGEKHLIGLLVILIINVALLWKLKPQDYKNNRKMIFLFMILFYLLEISKLTYITKTSGSFPMYQLPFHLCSLPLYLYPIMYFTKQDSKIQNIVKPAAFAVVLIAGIVALAMPTTIIGDELSWFPIGNNILPIISFTFHGLMIYSSLYLIRSRYYQFQFSDVLNAYLTTIPLLIVALIANGLMDKDFMSLNRGAGVPFNSLRNTSQLLFTGTLIVIAYIVILLVFITTKIVVDSKVKSETYQKKNAQ